MSSTPSGTPQTPGGVPPAVPPGKPASGAKIILWIAGILGAFVVLIIVVVIAAGMFVMHKAKESGLDTDLMKKNPALAVAKMAVTATPDVELVSSDDDAGTIVVRDKKTGKITTMKFDPEKKSMVVTDENGKSATITAGSESLEVKGADGTLKLGAGADKAPDWVPVYPGSTPQSNYSASNANEQNGSYTFVTPDAVDKVMSYYGDAMKSAGLTVSNTTTTSDGKTTGIVTGQNDGEKRTVMVTASSENDGTHVGVVYGSKK